MPDGTPTGDELDKALEQELRQQWATPTLLGTGLIDEWGLTVDVAATDESALCERWITKEQNALAMDWGPAWRCWLNPPFDDIETWLDHAESQFRKHGSVIGGVLPARVSTSPWFPHFSCTAEWWSMDGRVAYHPPPGIEASSPGFGSIAYRYGPLLDPGYRGVRCFETGEILRRVDPRALIDEQPRQIGRRWSLLVPGKPITKGNSGQLLKRGARIKLEPSKAAKRHQQAVHATALARPPTRKLSGPVRLDVDFRFRIPKTGDNRHREPGEWRTTTPDRGNLLKLIEDAIEGVAFDNDSIVVAGDVRKYWWPRDETVIVATEIETTNRAPLRAE